MIDDSIRNLRLKNCIKSIVEESIVTILNGKFIYLLNLQ